MQVVPRLAPVALERELLDRIDAAHPGNEPGRTLVLVPTTRLAAHLQRRLLARRPAWLGLTLLHFTGLTREILRRQPGELPHVATDLLLEALLRRLAVSRPHNAWIAFARERPGALRSLHESLEDLREAAVEPRIVAECCPDGGLAEIFEAYHEALESAGRNGWTDRAGQVRSATPHAAAYAREFRSIFVYGAYDWTGVNLQLLRELDRGRELSVFVPAQRKTVVSRFAEAFVDDFLDDATEADAGETPAVEPGVPRIDALFDESSHPAPVDEDRLTFAHAQGAAAEVKLAVREALRAVADGCPPDEIVLTARSLTPYATALEEIFDDERLEWTSSLSTPLRRVPKVREFLLLLKVVGEDFPRAATVALLCSPRIDWSALLKEKEGGPAPRPDLVDRWSREAGLIGGLEDWTAELPRWASLPRTYRGQPEAAQAKARAQAIVDGKVAVEIARRVEALGVRTSKGPRRWSAHAEQLRELLKIVKREAEDEVATRATESLSGLLDEMARLETLVGDGAEVAFEDMRGWLEKAVDRSQIELHPRDLGGIRVLDAMQMRGLTFRRVHLLGMNSGLFPRSPRESPALDDRTRHEIARRSGLPLGRKLDAADEERLLLAMVLGSARDTVHVSWQRADRTGKAQTPSLALRELARLRYGTPDLERLRDEARHLPAHPLQELEALLATPGLLSPRDAMLLTTLSSSGVAQAEAIGQRFEQLMPGLSMLRATESWKFDGPDHDARIGARPGKPAFSVSALETLGSCPLQFFFERVLKIQELPDEPTPTAIPAQELGTAVHDVLERLYSQLDQEGLFGEDRSVDLVERALALLEQSRGSLLGESGTRAVGRLPVLRAQLEQSWLDALIVTVRADLIRIANQGARLVGVEEQRRDSVNLGRGAEFELSARFDRRFENEDGTLVGDYKTSKNLSDRVNPTNMLKGTHLQVPLYQELAGPGSTVEILGIRPEFEEEETRVVFGGFEDDLRRESFRDTMRVLVGLNATGVYPFRAGFHCNWCRFAAACRKNHPPTVDREERYPDAGPFRELKDKSRTKPVRPSIGEDDV